MNCKSGKAVAKATRFKAGSRRRQLRRAQPTQIWCCPKLRVSVLNCHERGVLIQTPNRWRHANERVQEQLARTAIGRSSLEYRPDGLLMHHFQDLLMQIVREIIHSDHYVHVTVHLDDVGVHLRAVLHHQIRVGDHPDNFLDVDGIGTRSNQESNRHGGNLCPVSYRRSHFAPAGPLWSFREDRVSGLPFFGMRRTFPNSVSLLAETQQPCPLARFRRALSFYARRRLQRHANQLCARACRPIRPNAKRRTAASARRSLHPISSRPLRPVPSDTNGYLFTNRFAWRPSSKSASHHNARLSASFARARSRATN